MWNGINKKDNDDAGFSKENCFYFFVHGFFFLFSLLDLVNGRSEQGSDVDGNGSSDQRPFIVVAAASSSSENDADPNEAFIPTNDDNDANRPGFKLLTQEDLQRHSVLPTLKLNLSILDYFLVKMGALGFNWVCNWSILGVRLKLTVDNTLLEYKGKKPRILKSSKQE